MTDELEPLRQLRPPTAGPHPALVDGERNALMALITETGRPARPPTPPDHRRRRRRQRWLAPVLIVASGATAAAGWAVLRSDPKTSTAVACGDSIVGSSTGDPVADCAALWRRQKGTEPPVLVAYEGPGGGIHVLPEGETPPPGSKPLARSFRQETSIIELEAELGDVGRGLGSTCYSEADARGLVATQLRRLGLADWTITARTEAPGPVMTVPSAGGGEPEGEPCPADGTTYMSVIRPDTQEVELIAYYSRIPSDEHPFVELARALTRLLVDGPEARCVPVDEAAALARREAARLGMDELSGESGEVVFHVIPPADPNVPTCARPTTVVGGSVEVTLRAVAG